MPVPARCPHCSWTFDAPEAAVGRTLLCEQCAKPFVVKAGDDRDPDDAAPPVEEGAGDGVGEDAVPYDFGGHEAASEPLPEGRGPTAARREKGQELTGCLIFAPAGTRAELDSVIDAWINDKGYVFTSRSVPGTISAHKGRILNAEAYQRLTFLRDDEKGVRLEIVSYGMEPRLWAAKIVDPDEAGAICPGARLAGEDRGELLESLQQNVKGLTVGPTACYAGTGTLGSRLVFAVTVIAFGSGALLAIWLFR